MRVIVNPAAGSGDTCKRWPAAIVALREADLRPDYILTEGQVHAMTLGQQADLDGYHRHCDGRRRDRLRGCERLAACVGAPAARLAVNRDGVRPQTSLGAARWAGGTGSNHREGRDAADRRGLLPLHQARQEQEERAFLLLAGAGCTPGVIERSLGLKRWLGGRAYFAAALLELLSVDARSACLTLDGATEQVAVVEMMVLNAPWVGAGCTPDRGRTRKMAGWRS